jgi:hydroxymethylpyrimidine pyrophosphatase-like HAD family hydrolase
MNRERGQAEDLPLPSDKVLLVDLDKTLIDTSYSVTDPGIYQEISRVKSLGWRIGLTSDTPLESLLSWSERFGMNGPVIAERGSIIWEGGKTEMLFPESKAYFAELKTRLIKGLVADRVQFFHGDIVKFLNNNPRLKNVIDPLIVLVNAYRLCSISTSVREIDEEGKLNTNLGLLEQLKVRLKNASDGVPRNFEIYEDFNPEYGSIILSPEQVNKRSAAQIWMKKNGLVQIGIIGDSPTDILGSDIAIHYAVGNATDDYKEAAAYTSSQLITSGVVDILNQLR